PRRRQRRPSPAAPVLFDLDHDTINRRGLPVSAEISKFPLVRRDIAAEVDEDLGYRAILEELRRDLPGIVTDIGLFDIYRGTSVEKGKKSLAFRVLLQDTRRTLTYADVVSA